MSANSGRSGSGRQIDFPPLANGLDYVAQAMKGLADSPTPQDLKYVVLHLQAAVEVLLKVRLMREHWTLVLKDANKADRAKFEAGDFASITLDETQARLEHVVGVIIAPAFKESVKSLSRARNRLQHMGTTDSAELIEAIASQVLSGLYDFLHEHLSSGGASNENADVDALKEVMMAEVGRLGSLLKERMKAVNSALKNVREVVECPRCHQQALRLDAPWTCLFCHESWEDDSATLARAYSESVLGRGWWDVADGDDDSVGDCVYCEQRAMVSEARLRDEVEPVHICFSCGEFVESRKIDFCTGCGAWMVNSDDPEDTSTMCGTCWSRLIGRD